MKLKHIIPQGELKKTFDLSDKSQKDLFKRTNWNIYTPVIRELDEWEKLWLEDETLFTQEFYDERVRILSDWLAWEFECYWVKIAKVK